MTIARRLVRLLGWLLTPLVAWAASFVGAWIAAGAASGFDNPITNLMITAAAGLVTALLAALLWLRLIRRSTRLQHTLEVSPEGVPLAAIEYDQPEKPR